MSNLEDLQGRILAAMERIGAGLDGLEPLRPEPEAPAPGESVEELKAALEDERVVTSQLEERVRSLHERQGALEEELAAAQDRPPAGPVPGAEAGQGLPAPEVLTAMAQMEGEINKLRAVAAQLRDSNRALREAVDAGDGLSQDLLSASVEAELEALRADQSAAQAQADAILAALAPLVGETEDN